MKNLITCLVVCALSGTTFADTLTFADDGKADFNNIQAAVDTSIVEELVTSDQSSSSPGWTCGAISNPEYDQLMQRWLDDGTWDEYRLKDLSGIRGTTFVKTTFHIVAYSDGTGGMDPDLCLVQIGQMNLNVESIGLEFCLEGEIVYHSDDAMAENDFGDPPTAGLVPGTMNVYCVPVINGALAYASYPPGIAYVIMNEYMDEGEEVFGHEAGHYFGLHHTFRGTDGLPCINDGLPCCEECVDGSNCANCGDFICDTPADDNAGFSSNCSYIGNGTDSCNGDPFAPDGTNLMSYGSETCMDTYTTEQLAVFLSIAESMRADHLTDDPSCASIYTVDDDGLADFNNIQEAVEAATEGFNIVLMPGTYTSTTDVVVNMLGKALRLTSTDPDNPDVVAATIIDGEGVRRGILCDSGETSNTRIEGITIINGFAGSGGGVYTYNSSPTLTNCIFTGNSATSFGGGMYNYNSSPMLTNCIFTGNSADKGGGMYNYYYNNPMLTNCTFENNTADDGGGGMYNYYSSSPMLTNCTFENNTANDGGGMSNWSASSPTLTNCSFTNNTASFVGGMKNSNSNPTLISCIFEGNASEGDSGGGMGNDNSSPTLTNCEFTNNSAAQYGGGMHNENEATATVTSCNFVGNTAVQGGGIYNEEEPEYAPPTLEDTTVCGNTPDQIVGAYYGEGCCGNFVEDVCPPPPCPADINGDGMVGVNDVLAVIDQWGVAGGPSDVNGDGIVDVGDLLAVVGTWGPCE